ncbi:hypothetical protein NL676_036687 [Syzygium grande]|nr:hypothetical protein NL676_036687 [Syzygium grande]
MMADLMVADDVLVAKDGLNLGGDQRRSSLMGRRWNLLAFTGVAQKLQPRIRSDIGEELACCRFLWKTSRNNLRAWTYKFDEQES